MAKRTCIRKYGFQLESFLVLLAILWTQLATGLELSSGTDKSLSISADEWVLTHLDLDIHVRSDSVAVEGGAELMLKGDSSFGPTLLLNSDRRATMSFIEVESEGAEAEINIPHFENGTGRLAYVRFPKTFQQGSKVRVKFEYKSSGNSQQFVASDQIALASWVETWYPIPFRSKEEELTASLASAPGTTTFHLPAGWRSVSNGKLIDPKNTAADFKETWEVQIPAARSFVAAPYEAARHRSGERELGVYLLSENLSTARDQATILAKALEAMEARFGPYPYPTYSIAEIPENLVSWAASSEQGFIMATSKTLDIVGGNLPLFAHEAAHGWWGNLVNARGEGSKLCDETLAQYGAVISIEAIEGREAATEFLRYSREGYSPLQSALGYFFIIRNGGDKPLAKLTDEHWDHNLADSKGHWVYHMLRERVGDEVFFTTLRRIIQDFAGKSLTLNDLRQAFLNAAPNSGLDVFFSQWLDEPGAPVLDLDWWSVDRGKGVEIHLHQQQASKPYHLPLEIAIDMKDGATLLETLELKDGDQVFTLQIPSRAIRVRMDPNYKLLIWKPEYGPRPSFEAGGN